LTQIMTGFRKLHENNVIHRDFKPANVFLHNDTLLIGDFGMAKETHDKTGTVCGTPQTMAPEILGGGARTSYDNRADLWSIGKIYFM
jgi:serine/threonine protein kinase